MPTNENPEPQIPSTLERSPKKAQDTYEQTLASAEETYDGDQEAAHRAAWAAVKHSFEKVGDHWEPKAQRGPSDPRSEKSTDEAIRGEGKTYGGVDANGHTRDELVERAQKLGVAATSRMTKGDLAEAIAKKQR